MHHHVHISFCLSRLFVRLYLRAAPLHPRPEQARKGGKLARATRMAKMDGAKAGVLFEHVFQLGLCLFALCVYQPRLPVRLLPASQPADIYPSVLPARADASTSWATASSSGSLFSPSHAPLPAPLWAWQHGCPRSGITSMTSSSPLLMCLLQRSSYLNATSHIPHLDSIGMWDRQVNCRR